MADAEKIGGSGATDSGSYEGSADKITRLVTMKNKTDPDKQGPVLHGKKMTLAELDKLEGLDVIGGSDKNSERIAEKDREIERIRKLPRMVYDEKNNFVENPEWNKLMDPNYKNPILNRREIEHLKYELTGNYQYESASRTPDATYNAQQKAAGWAANQEENEKRQKLQQAEQQREANKPQVMSLDQINSRGKALNNAAVQDAANQNQQPQSAPEPAATSEPAPAGSSSGASYSPPPPADVSHKERLKQNFK